MNLHVGPQPRFRYIYLAILGLVGVSLSGIKLGAEEPESVDSTRSGATLKQDSYLGWEKAWRLRQAGSEVVVVPSIGRVISVSGRDGKNLLWVNPKLKGKLAEKGRGHWFNFGGDKLWPAPQDSWKLHMGRPWPPDHAYDGDACQAIPQDEGLRLITPVSKNFGSRAVREFTLIPGHAALRIRQWHEKRKGDPTPLCIWTVTQIRTPQMALLPLEKGRSYVKLMKGELPHGSVHREGSFLRIRNHAQKDLKVGVGGRDGWVAALIDRTLLVLSHRIDPGAVYPDQGCHAQVYAQKGSDGYVELELLSTLNKVAVGEKLQDDAVWQWLLVSDQEAKSAERLGKRAHRAHQQALRWLEEPKK